MKASDKLKLRRHEIVGKLNEYADKPTAELTDADRTGATELRTEMRDVDSQIEAAMLTEGATETRRNGDGEGAEIRRLAGVVRMSDYGTAIATRSLDGRAGEYNDALGVPRVGGSMGGVMIPHAALADPLPERVEARAVTSTTAHDGPTTQPTILQRLYGRDLLEALGVRMDDVPVGMTEYPLLTGGGGAAVKAQAAAADQALGAFDTQALKPRRLTGSYAWTAELAASVPGIEAAFRRDLADAIRAQMSNIAINGTGAGAQPTGLVTRIASPTDPSAQASFGDYAGAAARGVDGIHAASEGEVSVILGDETYRHAAGRIDAGSGTAGIEALQRRAARVVASSFVPDASSNVQTAFVHAGTDMARGDSIAAVWNGGVEVILDPYSASDKGETRLTWITLWDLYTAFRLGAYKRVDFKLVA